MELLSSDPTPSEPAGGWVGSQELIDTQILSLVLCKFTGDQVALAEHCPARQRAQHPDVPCHTNFFQAEVLNAGLRGHFDEANSVVRRPFREAAEVGAVEPS